MSNSDFCLTIEQKKRILAHIRNGIERKYASALVRVPYLWIEDTIARANDDIEQGNTETEDAAFLLDVQQAEAEFVQNRYMEVLQKASDHPDPVKALEVLARMDPTVYSTPGVRKVTDKESGAEGPAAALLRQVKGAS